MNPKYTNSTRRVLQ